LFFQALKPEPMTKTLYINSDQIQGRLAYQLPTGIIKSPLNLLQNTWPRQIGNLVSLISWLGLAWWGRLILKSDNHAKTN
jgi:hypothetical protein